VPEIFNTDQGCQFTSAEFTRPLLALGVKLSMDGKGRCLDNVFFERLWRSVKYEEIYLKSYRSLVDAHAQLDTPTSASITNAARTLRSTKRPRLKFTTRRSRPPSTNDHKLPEPDPPQLRDLSCWKNYALPGQSGELRSPAPLLIFLIFPKPKSHHN
jgi:transposase InsO family protein